LGATPEQQQESDAMKHNAALLFVACISFYVNADSLLIRQYDSLRQYENEVSRSKYLTVSGGILFGASYGLALLLTPVLASSPHKMDQDVSKVLWIPFAGPVVADIVDGMDEPVFTVLCIGWSLTELLGAGLWASGIKSKRKLHKNKPVLSLCPEVILGRYSGIELSGSF
jgi:hypothetical protein